MTKRTQKIYEGEIDVAGTARALRLPTAIADELLRDGRTISRFSEVWTTIVYGTTLQRVNCKGSDAIGTQDSTYSVKSLTHNGTAVRRSSNTGVSRTCTRQDVESAIDEVEGYQFVDNTSLPKVSFIQIPSGVIMRWFRDGHIGPTGAISYDKFYRILQAESDIIRLRVDLVDGSVLR